MGFPHMIIYGVPAYDNRGILFWILFCCMFQTKKIKKLLFFAISVACFWLFSPSTKAFPAAITNTATVNFKIGGFPQLPHKATATSTLVSTPAVVQFYQFIQSDSPSPSCVFGTDGFLATSSPIRPCSLLADGTTASNGSGVFSSVPPPKMANGTDIDISRPVSLIPTGVYHAGEPIFITLSDGNRNASSTEREIVEVTLTTTTGDREVLRLQETGSNTGVFAGVIQSVSLETNPADNNNAALSISARTNITVSYIDPTDPSDTAEAKALVDPFGIVFNSVTGAPVNGATVTLVIAATGALADVRGDDGVTPYPNPVISGGTADTGPAEFGKPSEKMYNFSPGEFRFPRVAQGVYRLVVLPPPSFSAPSTVPLSQLQSNPATSGFLTGQGSFGDPFTVGGRDIQIDIPIDPSGLVLEKSVNRMEASTGDFLSYQVTIRNTTQATVTGVTLTDVLPIGFRYQDRSARREGASIPNPGISQDGRTLTFPIGDVLTNSKVEIRYIAEVTAGVPLGNAVNRASANGVNASTVPVSPVSSNLAEIAVKIRSPFFSTHGTIIGRVVEGECNTPWENLVGIPNARIMMEDGTYVTTDRDGQYHFEKVAKGTHVVQLDLATLGPGWEVASCIQNTRFADRSYSQFVEMQGGMLWRADFYVHKKPVPKDIPALVPTATIKTEDAIEGVVGISLQGQIEVERKVALAGNFTLNLHFDTNKAILSSGDKDALNSLVLDLKKKVFARVDVTGHTDIRPTRLSPRSEFRDNYHLSMARANVVTQYLSEALRLPLNRFLISGKGPDEPVADNKTAYGMSRNRRTEVRILTAGEVKGSPRFDYHVDVDGRTVPVSNLRVMVNLQHGFRVKPGTVKLDGVPLSAFSNDGDIAVFSLGDQAENFSRRIDFNAYYSLEGADVSTPVTYESRGCLEGKFVTKAVAMFNAGNEQNLKTPAISNVLPCVIPRSQIPIQSDRGTELAYADSTSGRMEVVTKSVVVTEGNVPTEGSVNAPVVIPFVLSEDLDFVMAAGAHKDWLLGQTPGIEWLFPLPNHNPRAPVIRVVIKHFPNQRVVLMRGKKSVDPLFFDGTQTSADKTVSVSIWRGIPLEEGANWLHASIIDRTSTSPVSSFYRKVHYANRPAHVTLVPDQSSLIADGIKNPVLAVRVMDKDGKPVRFGVTGPFTIDAPFMPQQIVDEMQRRQLAGMDTFRPMWQVTGDDGIALIKLKPTTETGEIVAAFSVEGSNLSFGGRTVRQEIVRGYVKPAPRDFIVVGFAEGTVGYNTLNGNMQGLSAEGVEDKLFTDGQVSFYAKGRIRGDWLLTLSYDTHKPSSSRDSLFQTIDPNAFYTLYGDGTGQGYDATSQRKLYLKLEKNQFVALFGDFETGLTKSELARYSRALNGVKVSYQGRQVLFTAFAAETPQNFVRDEIQGAGTSGLYRLSRGGIVLNGERIRIETRDRLKSERIVETKSLTRHLDYDIDYPNGTLFFRQPIPARDTNFNPVFIVVEYEVAFGVDDALNAGGRVGVKLGELGEAGLSYIRNADRLTKTDLSGVDLKLKIPGGNELRLEGAASVIKTDGISSGIESGSAYLAEVAHHGKGWDVSLYTRLQDADFGVNQQNGAQGGMKKTGIAGKVALTPKVAISGEASHEENLVSKPTRDVVSTRLEFADNMWRAFAGLQSARDTSANGVSFDSRQAVVGASRQLFKNQLELSAHADLSLGKRGSMDYPSRYVVQAGWRITEATRLIVSHQISDGDAFNTNMTRVGLESNLWKGAQLRTTLNQNINEYGPRTFGVMGLSQSLPIGKDWGVDFALDQSRTFGERSTGAPILNANHPIAVGGSLGSGQLTEDYVALSAGATYRHDLWSWNGKVENRNGEVDKRLGFTTGFLREARAGVAFSSSLRLFQTERVNGTEGLLGNIEFALAYRPLGTRWSVLDKLQFRYETLENGSSVVGSGLHGNNSLTTTSQAKSRAFIHHFNLNYVSGVWEEKDRMGNLFYLNQRNQGSLYYGSKYSFDQYDGVDYKGYTDLLGIDFRHDFSQYLMDIGFHGDVLHSWGAHNYKYSVGPMIGISPVENAWITLGYNFKGFYDRDFEQARYTASGPYIKFRIKFDQNTRILPDKGKGVKP